MKKNQNGITLIALVITIIVLLILAGVSIAMLTGENGILSKASTAKDESVKAEVVEAVKLGIAEIQADKLDTTNTVKGTSGKLTVDEIAKAAMRNNSSIEKTKDATYDSTTEITTETSIPLTLNKTDYVVKFTPGVAAKPAEGSNPAVEGKAATITIEVVPKAN